MHGTHTCEYPVMSNSEDWRELGVYTPSLEGKREGQKVLLEKRMTFWKSLEVIGNGPLEE